MFTNFLICFILTFMSSYIAGDDPPKEKGLNFKILKVTEIKYDPGNVNVNNFSLSDLLHSDDGTDTPQTLSDTSVSSTHYSNGKPEITQKEILNKLDYLTNKIEYMQEDVEKSNCHFPSTSEGVNYNTLCQRMVGVSKPEVCKIIDDNHIEQVQSMKKFLPRSCQEIYESGENKSGLYEIQPKTSVKPLEVLCDMETRGGGWTHIQKRFDGSEDFYREWRDYKFGFGDLKREHWIGLENIYHITGSGETELLVELTDRDKIKAYAHYTGFAIGPESDGYPLHILRGFTGDAGDSLSPHINGKFSTKDLDQDSYDKHCAQLFLGGWWYKACHSSNLNGKYINVANTPGNKFQGLNWKEFRGHEYVHAGSRMLVRPAKA